MTQPETPSAVEEYFAKHVQLSSRFHRARKGSAAYDPAHWADKERSRIASEKRGKRTVGEKVSALRCSVVRPTPNHRKAKEMVTLAVAEVFKPTSYYRKTWVMRIVVEIRLPF